MRPTFVGHFAVGCTFFFFVAFCAFVAFAFALRLALGAFTRCCTLWMVLVVRVAARMPHADGCIRTAHHLDSFRLICGVTHLRCVACLPLLVALGCLLRYVFALFMLICCCDALMLRCH